MCIVNSKSGNYEIIISDFNDEVICSFDVLSISVVCRLIDEFDFDRAKLHVIKKSDNSSLDVNLIKSIWRSKDE